MMTTKMLQAHHDQGVGEQHLEPEVVLLEVEVVEQEEEERMLLLLLMMTMTIHHHLPRLHVVVAVDELQLVVAQGAKLRKILLVEENL